MIKPITPKDVKVISRCSDSTILQKWQTYFFSIGELRTLGIEKQNGVFKFWAKHCKTLQEAKQYIADHLNSGKGIYKL